MNFHPTADQRALIDDAFGRPLDALLPLDRWHRVRPAEPWSELSELGIFGIAVPEAQGGVGLAAVEEALLATALGAHLADPPVIATLMARHLVAEPELAALAAGATRIAPGFVSAGRLCLVAAEHADLLLIQDEDGAALLSTASLVDRAPLRDRHWGVALEVAALPPAPIAAAPATMRRLRLIEAAALAGIAAAARDMAVAYASLREQFGHPIGAFQAIKHRCADMAVAALAAGDQVSFAATALDQARPDAGLQVEAALLVAIDAALANARANVQIHGGIGFSDEANPHLLVKHAHLLVALAGGAEAAADRVAAAGPAMAG